jgi:hypothetical protein
MIPSCFSSPSSSVLERSSTNWRSGCLGVLTLGQRVARLPLVGRSNRLHGVYRRVADSTQFSRPTLVAGLLLLGCWTSRALGSTLLLSAIGVRFSPTIAALAPTHASRVPASAGS